MNPLYFLEKSATPTPRFSLLPRVGLLLILFGLVYMPNVQAQTATGSQVYIWNLGPGATSGDWTTPANWTPNRTNPAPTDVLIFNQDHSAATDSTIATNVPTEQIGQLRIDQLANVTLIPAASSELTINGIAPTNAGLAIGANAILRFYNETEDQALVFSFTPGAQALISGNLIFGGLGPEGENEEAVSLVSNAPHRLLAYQPRSVTFLTGSQFFAQKIQIDPFGDNDTHGVPNNPAAIENVIIFQEGSSYRHWSGPEPFGLDPPASIVQFMSGSTYLLERAGAPSTFGGLGGRTFGNVIVNLSRLGPTQQTIPILSNNALPVAVENLTILHGNLDFSLVTSGPTTEPINIHISGSFIVAAEGNFNFNPSAPSTLSLIGAGPQSISGTGTFVFGENTTLHLNSPADVMPNTVTLLTPLTLNGDLRLTRGFLETTTGNLLTINPTGSVVGGSVNSFVDGPLAQTVSSTTPVSLNFPLGVVDFAEDARRYRPLSLNNLVLASANPTTFTVTKSETPPAARALPTTIDRVSDVRHYTVIKTPGTTPVLSGSITISYGPDDGVLDPESLRIATSSGIGVWTVLESEGETPGGEGAPSGSITGILPDAPTFGDFVLANATNGNNPLPVELISFTAQKERQGVLLKWATASEKNNQGFEVLRSTDGVEWVKAGFVNGNGNSQAARSYAFTDKGASLEAATLYYRLMQIDLDGTFAYSKVVAIQTDMLDAPLALYPNPVADILNLNLGQVSQNIHIRIVNLLGQVVFEKDYPTQTSQLIENVSFLPAGAYQLEVLYNQNRTFRKFVKTSR